MIDKIEVKYGFICDCGCAVFQLIRENDNYLGDIICDDCLEKQPGMSWFMR